MCLDGQPQGMWGLSELCLGPLLERLWWRVVSSDTLKEPGVWYRVWIVGFSCRFIHVFTFVGCVCVCVYVHNTVY